MVSEVENIPFDYKLEHRYSPVYKKPIRQLTLAVPGGGCKLWLDTKGRCCPFCAFNGLIRSILKGEGAEEDFEGWLLDSSIFTKMYEKAVGDINEFDKLAVFNGGSFLIDTEIPRDFRNLLYDRFARHPTARQLMVESIVDGITEAALMEALERLAGKDLMIGVGLESADNRVRNKLLRKATSLNGFERAVRLMQSLGVQIFVYAFLKAPGLNEREALADVTATMSYLSDLGVDEIGLSCAFVQAGTPLEEAYRTGEFRPPWLWSILELIDRANDNGWPLSVGGFEDFPPPLAIANNCADCDEDVLAAIDRYRKQGVLPNKEIYCTCKEGWEKEMAA